MPSGRRGPLAAAVLTAVLAALFAVLLPAAPAGALPAWPSVAQGDSGTDTVTVQHLLRQHGHGIAADGNFGPATASAVTAFQTARGLPADGRVGPQTWPHLVVTVQQGSSGEAVKAAQTQLNAAGAGIAVDGTFGPATDAAVRAYQGANGLGVDGQVGPQTWQSLVGGGGGGTPSGHALPLDRSAAGRADYAASHWNSTPAVDLMVSYVPAYAVTGGTVDHYDSASCGIGVRLMQPDGSRIIYCHLSARSVAEGAQVAAGARVGTTGDTGSSGDPHLHVEIRTSDGAARCPQNYLLAIYDGTSVPALNALPTSGCTG
jgi:murein DD-endopeptidase MepM/ murein hydrolase activator NlpD